VLRLPDSEVGGGLVDVLLLLDVLLDDCGTKKDRLSGVDTGDRAVRFVADDDLKKETVKVGLHYGDYRS
jgi:hypothetical protein